MKKLWYAQCFCGRAILWMWSPQLLPTNWLKRRKRFKEESWKIHLLFFSIYFGGKECSTYNAHTHIWWWKRERVKSSFWLYARVLSCTTCECMPFRTYVWRAHIYFGCSLLLVMLSNDIIVFIIRDKYYNILLQNSGLDTWAFQLSSAEIIGIVCQTQIMDLLKTTYRPRQ